MSSEEVVLINEVVSLETSKAELCEDNNDCTILEHNLNTKRSIIEDKSNKSDSKTEEYNRMEDDAIQENNITSTEKLENEPVCEINIANSYSLKDTISNNDSPNSTPRDGIDSVINCSNAEDDTIALDSSSTDDTTKDMPESNSCIVLEDSPDDCIVTKTPIKYDIKCYDQLYRDNKHFLKLVEKCINMENSEGMLRIMNKSLINVYLDADEKYRKSEEFNTFLAKQLLKLDNTPERKFTHVKEICEILKIHKAERVGSKKKVPFVTVDTNLRGSRKRKKSKRNKAKKRKVVTEVAPISCDSDTDVEIINEAPIQIVIDDDNHLNDSEHPKDSPSNDDGVTTHKNDNFDKENDVININSQELLEVAENISNVNDNIVMIDDEENNPNKENTSITNEPLKPKEINLHNNHSVQEKIKAYETEIEFYNKIVKNLETKEVLNDRFNSPYVLCEEYKNKIVEAYKELCKLTGAEAVKRHEVRLKVAAGHPEGPVRCLEEFVNDNIDEYGNPPFPEMGEVIACVEKANRMYNLNWTHKQIAEEARALSIFYGRAMQKRRKRREWRHLLRYVKEEALDPAEVDPVLEAKLVENDRIGRKREQELLNRYVEIEQNSNFELNVENESEDSDKESTVIPTTTSIRSRDISQDKIALNTYENSCNGKLNNNVSLFVSPEKTSSLRDDTTSKSVNIEIPIPNNCGNSPTMVVLCNTSPAILMTNIQNLPVYISGSVLHNIQNLPSAVNIPNALINPPQVDATNINQPPADLINPSSDALLVNQPKDISYFEKLQKNIVFESDSTEENVGSFHPIDTHTVKKESAVHNPAQNRIVFENGLEESQIEDTKLLQDDIEDVKNVLEADDIKVKKESEDLPLLKEIGDVTATVFAFEDPFLIVEISDSSDSEVEDL